VAPGHKKYTVMVVYLVIGLNIIYPDENIISFDNIFTLAVSSKYNYLRFLYEDNKSAESNALVDIGFNFSRKNLSLSLGIGIPFTHSKEYEKSTALDVQLKYCNDFIYGELFFKYYDGFHNDSGSVDLKLLSGGLSGEFILNKEHSLRSVYRMDRLQTISNGSFLLGLNASGAAITSDDINYYQNEMNYIHFGPNIGYSYTWTFGHNYFINIFLVIGPDLCLEYNSSQYFFAPQIMSKITTGKHNNSWSINFELESNHVSFSERFSISDALLSTSACITISMRF
jgi:hypothetical protein